MPWLVILGVLRKAGPAAVKQLPKLWPLLLEKKNREKLVEAIRDLASQSPAKRLRARVKLTAALADDVAERSSTEEERARARDWSKRANNLLLRLDMPVQGRAAKAAHRTSVREQLEVLQQEMDNHLGS
jgi:hypothetical protein